MLPAIFQKMEQGARLALPFITAFLLVAAESFPWPIPGFGIVVPSLGLSAVYFWSVNRPDLVRPSLVFFLGLLHDGIAALPLGFSSLLYLALYQLVSSQRRIFVGHAFFMLWWGFALVLLIATLLQYFLLSMFQGGWIRFLPVLFQAGLTLFFFPFVSLLLIRLQRYFSVQG